MFSPARVVWKCEALPHRRTEEGPVRRVGGAGDGDDGGGSVCLRVEKCVNASKTKTKAV